PAQTERRCIIHLPSDIGGQRANTRDCWLSPFFLLAIRPSRAFQPSLIGRKGTLTYISPWVRRRQLHSPIPSHLACPYGQFSNCANVLRFSVAAPRRAEQHGFHTAPSPGANFIFRIPIREVPNNVVQAASSGGGAICGFTIALDSRCSV